MPEQPITPFWSSSARQLSGTVAYRGFYYLLMALFLAVFGAHTLGLPWAGTLTWIAVLIFFVGIVIVGVLAFTITRRAARRRAKRIPHYQDFARRQGWDYQPGTDAAWLAKHFSANMRTDGIRPFRSAADPDMYSFSTRDAFNGSWRGKPFVAFSYSPPSERMKGGDDD